MLPQGWDRRTIVLLTFAFLFVITANLAHAQVFDLERDRVQMAELNGLWRFHTGDDPDGKLGWADPRFDDSSWPMLYADQPWNDPRYQGYSGFAWFRIKVRRPVTPMLLALFIPNLPRSYRVFAEGIAIGGIGGMPPHESIVLAHDQIYLLPRPREDARETSTLAFRVWYSRTPRALNGGPSGREGNLRIGDAIVIENWRRFVLHDAFWQIVIVACQLPFELIAAIAGFVLFVFSRSEKEYLWFAGFNFTGGVFDCWAIHSRFFATPRWEEFWVIVISVSGYWLLITLFLFSLLKTRRNWLYWCTLASLLFAFFAEVVRQSNLPTALWKIVTYPVVHFAVIVCLALVIYKGAKRGSEDARFLLVPFLGFLGWEFLGTFLNLMHELGYESLDPLRERLAHLGSWPFPFGLGDVISILFDFSCVFLLILRFVRSRRSEERMSSELEAARTVQQVLIPEEIPTIPGLALECIYRPAGQVGGDFFQILATRNNGALIVIGDVSGKGMPAAMAVSLLVGTVRTLAHYTHSPAEILTSMNQRMLARSKDGFTTCLVLRIDSDGTATVANAGHLAPYLGAQELAVDSGLPLGLVAEAVYTESSFQLETGQELTLITDGVAEARAKTGELFGFERTASISILSAEHIAATAKAFGQEDDITVLKIRRCPVPEPALTVPAALTALSTNPA